MKRGNKHNENVFELDKNRLDDEWLAQPLLMDEYTELLANARNDTEVAKNELKRVEAKVAGEIRRNPDRYRVLKPTDKAVEAAVLEVEEYQEALEDFLTAKHKQELYQAKVDSLEHRKKALENLVWLFGANYFASPSANKATPEAINKVRESRDKKVRGIKPKHHGDDGDDD